MMILRKYHKNLIYTLLACSVLAISYTNCAPSFQSSNDLISTFDEGSLGTPVSNTNPAFPEMMGGMDVTNSSLLKKLTSSEDGYNCSAVTKAQMVKLLNTNIGPLTNRQYEYSIRGLFGVNIAPGLPESYDEKVYNTSFGITTPGIELVEAHFSAAIKVIDAIGANNTVRTKVYDCGGNNAQCLSNFVAKWGRLLYRRPLNSTEITTVITKADESSENLSDKLENALYLMLVSPNFTYRVQGLDLATNAKSQQLNEYDFASRLSFFIWGQGPDEALLDKAANNEVRSDLTSIINTMLDDPRSEYIARELAYNWFNMGSFRENSDKNYGITGITVGNASWSLAEQVTNFMKYLISNNRPVTELVDSNVMFHTDKTSKIYGQNSSGMSGNFKQTTQTESHLTAGVLSHMGLWAQKHSQGEIHVFKRGPWVSEKIICNKPVGDPSGAVFSAVNEGFETISEGVKHLSTRGNCKDCHSVMDPYGMAVENFDSLGRYRPSYNNNESISYSTTLEGSSINSVKDLSVHIATKKAEYVNYCATKNLMTLAMSKDLFSDGSIGDNNAVGSCLTLDFYSKYVDGNEDIKFKDLIKKIIIDGAETIGSTSKLGTE